jgi:hypothetical protein
MTTRRPARVPRPCARRATVSVRRRLLIGTSDTSSRSNLCSIERLSEVVAPGADKTVATRRDTFEQVFEMCQGARLP